MVKQAVDERNGLKEWSVPVSGTEQPLVDHYRRSSAPDPPNNVFMVAIQH